MSFKDMLKDDIKNVFLNTSEFADSVSIRYNGTLYEDIPVLLTNIDQWHGSANASSRSAYRKQSSSNNADGVFQVSRVMYVSIEDLEQMEINSRIELYDTDGYIREYYITGSDNQAGMVRYELGAYDE